MTTMELDTQKVNLVKEILNETDENVVIRVMDYIRIIKEEKVNLPCRMTIEELHEEIKQSLIDYKNGLGTTHEEFLKEQAEWF
jgi:hypothetical protein